MIKIMTTKLTVSSVSFSIFVNNSTPVTNKNIDDDQGARARSIKFFCELI